MQGRCCARSIYLPGLASRNNNQEKQLYKQSNINFPLIQLSILLPVITVPFTEIILTEADIPLKLTFVRFIFRAFTCY